MQTVKFYVIRTIYRGGLKPSHKIAMTKEDRDEWFQRIARASHDKVECWEVEMPIEEALKLVAEHCNPFLWERRGTLTNQVITQDDQRVDQIKTNETKEHGKNTEAGTGNVDQDVEFNLDLGEPGGRDKSNDDKRTGGNAGSSTSSKAKAQASDESGAGSSSSSRSRRPGATKRVQSKKRGGG